MRLSVLSCAIALCVSSLFAAEPPKEIAAHFQPPKELAGDFGNLKSVLKFNDGTPVKTAADWAKRGIFGVRIWQWLGLTVVMTFGAVLSRAGPIRLPCPAASITMFMK
jgi:hypothetical protein